MDYTPFIVTFKLAMFTTLILLIIGLPLAYFLSFSRFKGKILLESLLMLPIVLPPTVLGFYFLVYLGPNSTVGHFFETTFGLSFAFTFEGILLGSIIYCAPFMISPLITGFREIPSSIIESGKLLNKSKFDFAKKVLIPTIKNSILNASLLTFAHTIGQFGLILMIGGKLAETNTVSVAIYDEMNSMQFDAAHWYSLSLLIISFVLIITINIIAKYKFGNRA
jgi:molybdate transport system permease protein